MSRPQRGEDGFAAGEEARTLQRLVATYARDGRRWDELLEPDGGVRPPWQRLIQSFRDPAPTATRRALAETRRLIIESGVTYNVYADPQGADRPWVLDPLPVLLTAAEWQEIESGVKQRARLLDALLADLYGEQRLLAEGIVPPALVFGHPSFLWPCTGVAPRSGIWLHLYAGDLMRAPDGRWRVLSDRTQAPSGAGYALENREIIEQVLPDSLAALKVRRIGDFFGSLHDELHGGTLDADGGLAVVLTPGPLNETYFEQAYLARQLGLPLVEGSDLTVRDDTVYLKTLAGLKRVHSILRRLDDDFCDPVELRSDSALGIAGLISAIRAGRVSLSNALGSGVLESPAWLGFLPRVAERLLGEPLELPHIATWWCGESAALDHVVAHLDGLVIKPTYPNQRFEPVLGASLTGPARARLIERLMQRPQAYVAQELVPLSLTPAWRSGTPGFAARAFSIRTYCLRSAAGLKVMAGGLARIAAEATLDVVSTQRGDGSKDVWVLEEAGGGQPAGLPGALAHLPPRSEEIPSSLVENLYWLGRYAVRCDSKARLLRSTLSARIDASLWPSALRMCQYFGLAPEGTDPAHSLHDERNAYGILADVRRLVRCASQVRARLSSSAWRAVADMQRHLSEGTDSREEPRAVLDQLLLSLAALTGFALDDTPQDAGWRLLRVGRRIERLQFVAQLLAGHLSSAQALAPSHVEWLLEAVDSTRVYRSRYAVAPRLGPMLDLLVLDPELPRSLTYLWERIGQDLAALDRVLGAAGPQGVAAPVPPLTPAALLALQQEGPEAEAARQALTEQLRELAASSGQLSDHLALRHFAHVSLDWQALAT
jgi:uncharacterized circularly permuted ATP-grasp superfamily protein/uncharacterized alpha-E superfamily protein